MVGANGKGNESKAALQPASIRPPSYFAIDQTALAAVKLHIGKTVKMEGLGEDS